MFRPQHQYDGCLRERFEEFPKTAVHLLENLLSIDPEKRGTASSALMSEVEKNHKLKPKSNQITDMFVYIYIYILIPNSFSVVLLLFQYFNTKPYACEPSTLPKYPPNKEMDAKYREELQRRYLNRVSQALYICVSM